MEVDLSLFPHNWDIDNKQQLNYYIKCLPYVNSEDDFDNIIKKSTFFHIFGIGSITYFIILSLLLLKYRKHYIFKRQGRTYVIFFMIGSIISSFNAFFIQIRYKVYPCVVHNFIIAIGYPLSFFSYALIILTNFKNYYTSQTAYIEIIHDPLKKKTEKFRFIFKFVYENMPQSKVTTCFIFYLIFKWIIVYILYFTNELVYQEGYCKMSFIHLPQIIEILVFLLIFLPMALIEVVKFDDTFKMKKKIIRAILTTFICFLGYMTMAIIKSVNCSVIVKYAPSDSFVILVFLCSSIYLCVPTVKDIIHVEKQKSETKATTNGMLKMLGDNVLLREFSEFCRKENCTENILFYQQYWRYKKLFENQRNSKIVKTNNYHTTNSNIFVSSAFDYEDRDQVSQISFETSIVVDDSYTTSIINGMDPAQANSDNDMSKKSNSTNVRKITKNDIFLREAKSLIDNFIYIDSKFELNISDKVSKKIIHDFKEIKNNELQQQDFKNRLKCLFDEAYNEVLNSLFLNSYSNYISIKRYSNSNSK